MKYTGYCTAAAQHTLLGCQSSTAQWNPLDLRVRGKDAVGTDPECLSLWRVTPSGQVASVSCTKLPLPGLRQRSRTCFLVRVCQGDVVGTWTLTDLLGHAWKRQDTISCSAGQGCGLFRSDWFWCFFVVFWGFLLNSRNKYWQNWLQ